MTSLDVLLLTIFLGVAWPLALILGSSALNAMQAVRPDPGAHAERPWLPRTLPPDDTSPLPTATDTEAAIGEMWAAMEAYGIERPA